MNSRTGSPKRHSNAARRKKRKLRETSDAKALYSWLSYWNDLLEFETTPCVEDAEAGEVMAAVKR